VALACGISTSEHQTASRPAAASTSPSSPRPAAEPGRTAGTGSSVGLIVLTAAFAVAVAVAAVIVWRSDHRNSTATDDATAMPPMRQVLEQGASALAVPNTPRAAILACYQAMESSLAQAGARRVAAETPTDLLTRAARTGLVLPSSAHRLIELFAEARFSEHAMTSTQQEQAMAALASIRDALSEGGRIR